MRKYKVFVTKIYYKKKLFDIYQHNSVQPERVFEANMETDFQNYFCFTSFPTNLAEHFSEAKYKRINLNPGYCELKILYLKYYFS